MGPWKNRLIFCIAVFNFYPRRESSDAIVRCRIHYSLSWQLCHERRTDDGSRSAGE